MTTTSVGPTAVSAGPSAVGRWAGRLWLGGLWLCLAGLGGWAVVRGFGLDHRTPLAQLVSYTPFVGVFSLVVLVAALATRNWRAAAAAALAVLIFGAFVLPREVGGGGPSDGGRLRVVAFNTKVGAGSVAEVMALLRKERPDVFTVQELTPEWAERFQAAGAAELLPYRALRALPGALGTGIWARYPLTGGRTADPRSGFDQTYAVLRRPGKPAVQVVSAHPRPPTLRPNDWGSPRKWAGDITRLPGAPSSGPVLLMAGDFNSSLDHSPLRKLIGTGYRDAAATVGRGLDPTWPYDGQRPPPVTIDHVLVDKRAGAAAFRTKVIAGSDHKAIVADLILPE